MAKTFVCEECGSVFYPTGTSLARRKICYKPECWLSRQRKRLQAKMKRVKELKDTGEWVEHYRSVKGKGKGTSKGPLNQYRYCLRCGDRFAVPLDTDWRICPRCHHLNKSLIEEYTEDALGINSSLLSFGAGRTA